MEQRLRNNLMQVALAYADSRKLELSTLGRLAAGYDFFGRIKSPKTSFTARKYDEVMRWFSDNWPPEDQWPAHVERPIPSNLSQSRRSKRVKREAQINISN